MRILVTGALGYIGSELINRLRKQTHSEIVAVDNDIDSIKSRLGYILKAPNITFINADITDYKQVLAIPKVDIIVHLASVVGYISCGETPELAYQTNVVGTANITALNRPIIFTSTGSVYGKIGDLCDETVEPNPQSLYAETKIKAEQAVKQGSHLILRPATAFGLSFKVRHDLLVHTLIRDAISNKKIDLYQPTVCRSFYSVQKLAQLLEYAIFNYAKFENKTINVGCASGNIQKIEICNIIRQYINFELNIVSGEDLDSRDYNVMYTRLKNLWPSYDEQFSAHIPKIVEYYKAWH